MKQNCLYTFAQAADRLAMSEGDLEGLIHFGEAPILTFIMGVPFVCDAALTKFIQDRTCIDPEKAKDRYPRATEVREGDPSSLPDVLLYRHRCEYMRDTDASWEEAVRDIPPFQ